MNRLAFRAAPVFALVCLPSLALAADPPKGGSDPAAAQSLFYEARTLMQQNRFADACPKLEESLRLDPGIGTEFNLADCNEHLGKITSAWAGYLDVAAASKSTNQPERERLARKRAAALEPRLPKLVVEVSAPSQDLEVKRDGVLIGPAAWGTAIPVDPGAHRIVAAAPGKQTWETTVTAVESKTVKVSVPRDLPAAVAGVGAPVSPAPAGAITTSTSANESVPPPVTERAGGTQRALGWITSGIGVVGLGVGAGFGLASMAKRNDSRSHCNVNDCDAIGVGLRDDATRAGNVATIASIAGGAAVALGLVLVLTAPKGEDARERVGALRAVPSVGANSGGFTVQGAFQ